MAKKRSKLKTKVRQAKRKLSRKKLSKLFLLLIASLIFISIGSYFIFSNENELNKIEKSNLESNKTSSIYEEKQTLNEKKIFDELKIFENKKIEENIIKSEEKTKDEHFEETNFELEKSYIEENKENINEKIVQKIEEIKKINDEKTTNKLETKEKTTKKTEEEKEQKTKKTEVPKANEESIISSKDKYIHDPKKKPKLVIIIDDVSTQKQKESILNVGYPITMAFLPPTPNHPNSAQIAKDIPFHMIHFPMQASSAFKGPELDTLKITDSYEKIEARVKQLREWYPKAVYTNNHTGSVFTENDEAMAKLYKALDKYNFIFVDSRTSPKSLAKKYSVKYNMPYIVRNTFLDNTKEYSAIQNQLKDAIRIAKKQGYAIAIGHPYDITIKVLKESKHLLNEVEPVLLNKLPYL
ncbi:divergent polysaccharide deacetylase [Aliarcobacter faecis]|uniref:divergent polysaccharide deacetylase family protein n=1 Tax=Aliarcobacter faecis TaxID=1564138 RepID=UPI00047D98BF|nr:divergent polysaccharide deacetylase family protein [Aliarcobacter faecis]QKF74189.1 divergent polysaccharide deacetylase [Aliarcobacter faecis]